jgi:hypothetical protein
MNGMFKSILFIILYTTDTVIPQQLHQYTLWNLYEGASKIFRTGVGIDTAVVVARSTGPNRANCEFQVLL